MYLHEDRSGGSLLASMDVQSIGRIYSTIYSLGIIRVAQIITYISCLSRKCERMLLALSSLIRNQSQYLKVYVCVCVILINCIFFLKAFVKNLEEKSREERKVYLYPLFCLFTNWSLSILMSLN
jgi:hypothetical protein